MNISLVQSSNMLMLKVIILMVMILRSSNHLDTYWERFTRNTSKLMMVSIYINCIDDEILEISGHAGGRINELKFKTYRGKEESFGVKNGVHFVYSFPGHTFGAVSGGYEKHLDYIRIHVNELPPHKHHLKIIIIKN